ncbi:MAG: hypothetical protein JWQ01_4799 [Massilia sp.]|nr:hypothetical protein [Massilia sp.]
MSNENMTFSAVSIGHDAEFQRHIDDIYTAMGSVARREATARLAVFIDGRQRQAVEKGPVAIRDDALEDAAVICRAVAFTTEYPSSAVATRCASEIRSAISKLAGNGEGE